MTNPFTERPPWEHIDTVTAPAPKTNSAKGCLVGLGLSSIVWLCIGGVLLAPRWVGTTTTTEPATTTTTVAPTTTASTTTTKPPTTTAPPTTLSRRDAFYAWVLDNPDFGPAVGKMQGDFQMAGDAAGRADWTGLGAACVLLGDDVSKLSPYTDSPDDRFNRELTAAIGAYQEAASLCIDGAASRSASKLSASAERLDAGHRHVQNVTSILDAVSKGS